MKTITITSEASIKLLNLLTLADVIINPEDLILNVETENTNEGETEKIDLNEMLSEISEGIISIN